MAPIMTEQSPTPVVVMRVAGIAVIGDGFVGATGILARDDMRVLERNGGGAPGTETITPIQPQVRFVCQPIEPATARHRHVATLHAAVRGSNFTELDVIARTTITIDATTEFVSARAGLHDLAAYFAIPDFADA